MIQQINGFVELPAEYVYEAAFNGIKLIEKRRDKNRQEAVWEVMWGGIFRKILRKLGFKVGPRSEQQCIKILKECDYGLWWVYNVSYFAGERYEQMQELVAAARIGKPMLVTTEIAGHLEWVMSQ
jgi:hypothetical protein